MRYAELPVSFIERSTRRIGADAVVELIAMYSAEERSSPKNVLGS